MNYNKEKNGWIPIFIMAGMIMGIIIAANTIYENGLTKIEQQQQIVIMEKDFNGKEEYLGWTWSNGTIYVRRNESKEIMYNVCNHEAAHTYIFLNNEYEEEILDQLWGHLQFDECNTFK